MPSRLSARTAWPRCRRRRRGARPRPGRMLRGRCWTCSPARVAATGRRSCGASHRGTRWGRAGGGRTSAARMAAGATLPGGAAAARRSSPVPAGAGRCASRAHTTTACRCTLRCGVCKQLRGCAVLSCQDTAARSVFSCRPSFGWLGRTLHRGGAAGSPVKGLPGRAVAAVKRSCRPQLLIVRAACTEALVSSRGA